MSWLLNSKIRSKLSSFDLLALLRLLKHKGFKSEHIMFIGNCSLTTQDRLIEDVIIYDESVDIVVNFGLLGAQTPLPSRWLKKLEKNRDIDPATEKVLGLLDHFIILDYIAGAYPNINTGLFESWKEIACKHLFLENYNCNTSLIWIFTRIFPEFDIEIRNSFYIREKNCQQVIVGKQMNPVQVSLGGLSTQKIETTEILMRHKARTYRAFIDWNSEVINRIDRMILPIFSGMDLSISIKQEEYEEFCGFNLDGDSILGKDSIVQGVGRYKEVTIFEGRVKTNRALDKEINWRRSCLIKP
ncbi:hypothetical protein [Microbulbifer variabilis]|uniref:hypothetical protein n=1 Tax=Microbulbifer variabilis TaxID=266805 RepID=UPI001CFEA93E|nr:hypothetical protein [Microbulbifer variabilis]